MKKGAFYILLSGNKTEAKTGWIYTTSRNTYGIDNRGDKARPRWIITDILTGYNIGSHYPTRAAAIDQIERMDDFISEKHSAPEHAAARAAIAEAYRNGTPAAEETPAARYIIEFYNSNGTPRAEIRRAAASAPELDIPAADIDAYKKEITKNTRGKVEFIEKAPAELGYLLRRPTEEQKNKERAFLSDYIIEARDSSKIERLLKDTSNRAELFWEEVRAIAGNLSDHAQSRYQVLAEALYKRRFTAPTAPAADEAEQIPTESHSAPQRATETATTAAEEITPEETPKKYVFRIYENWTVYAGRLSESIITAGSDQEAQEIAIRLAAGRAFTCNRMEEAPKDPQRDAETRATITDGETPAEAAEAPQRATEDTQSALYIVQCRSPRRRWIDYSSPAPLEKCEEIKATAEARRTCSNNGELLQYRITEAAPAEAAESPAEAHGETQTGNTAEARRTPAETRGGQHTAHGHRKPHRGTERAHRDRTSDRRKHRTKRARTTGKQGKPQRGIVFFEKVNETDPPQKKSAL